MNCGTDGGQGTGFSCAIADPGVGGGGGGGGGGTTPLGGTSIWGFPSGGGGSGICCVMEGGFERELESWEAFCSRVIVLYLTNIVAAEPAEGAD